MVNHSVAPHRRHDLKSIGDCLGGESPSMFGRLWPGSFHIESAAQDSDDGPMTSASELRRGRIGYQEQSLHLPTRVLS